MKIIVVGEGVAASRTPQRVNALKELGHEVIFISTTVPGQTYEDKPSLIKRIRHKLRIPSDLSNAGQVLLDSVKKGADFIWLDNVNMIKKYILYQASRSIPLIWYSEDDMMNKAHGSVYLDRSLDLFTLWATTKSFNTLPAEMPSRGVKNILFVNNSYDPTIHNNTDVSPEDIIQFGADISFVGTFEIFRANSILYLAQNGLKVRIWGNGWHNWVNKHDNIIIENKPVYQLDYVKVICSSKVNLCFLRKFNRDLQTCRSVEIPACGGFMVHERNSEITSLFTEDKEAVYFNNDKELLATCRYWLDNNEERKKVASNGYNKVRKIGLSHHDLVSKILQTAQRIKNESTS